MCSPVAMVVTGVLGTAMSAYGSYQQSMQQQSALQLQAAQAELQAMSMNTQAVLADAQASTSDTNSRLAEMDADQALLNSQKEAKQKRIQALQLIGEEKAAYAASGVSVHSGSAVGLYSQTAYAGELDAQSSISQGLEDNLSYMTDSVNYKNQSDAQKIDAMGMRTQALMYDANASNLRSQASSINPFISTLSSVVSGVSTVASGYWNSTKSSYLQNLKSSYGL